MSLQISSSTQTSSTKYNNSSRRAKWHSSYYIFWPCKWFCRSSHIWSVSPCLKLAMYARSCARPLDDEAWVIFGIHSFILGYYIFIYPIIYNPIVNNATSHNNVYLCWIEEEWGGIIKYLESSLKWPKCTFYGHTERRMPKVEQLLLILHGVVSPLIQVVPHGTKRRQKPGLAPYPASTR